jgi:hypothetical protein
MLLTLYSNTSYATPVAASIAVADSSGSIVRNGTCAASYQLGQLVSLSASFSESCGTTPVDPSAVLAYVQSPDGAVTEYAYSPGNSGVGQIVRDGPGAYSLDIVVGAPGPWIYDWVGTGYAPVASGDVYFQVEQSTFASLIGG